MLRSTALGGTRSALVVSLLPGLALGQFLTGFYNPILPGFHPDPSCIHLKEDDTFYCASSSFNAFPGIPIHASKDLTTWRLVGELRPSTAVSVTRRRPRVIAGVGNIKPNLPIYASFPPLLSPYWPYR